MVIKLQSSRMSQYNLDLEEKLWAYCSLDCAVDYEICEVLEMQLDPETTKRTYEFSRLLMGPFLSMMRRGFRLDHNEIRLALEGDPDAAFTFAECGPNKKYETVKEARIEIQNRTLGLLGRSLHLGGMVKDETRKTGKWQIQNVDAILQELAVAASGETVNYHSPKQLQKLLYGALRLPEITKVERGKVKVMADREALERLAQNYPRAKLICNTILKLRELEKLTEVLQKKIDTDGRMRCSFNIVGTKNGRPSSSESVWDTGMNLQNVTSELRRIFIPDDGKILFNADLEQAESRAVAYISQDEGYIHACESADLHTTVASMLFDIPNERSYADGNLYYRHFTYRDMAKRAGHALNYGLSPHSLARQMHISVKAAFKVYLLYLGGEKRADDAANLDLYDLPHEKDGRFLVFPGAFPGIRRWHEDVRDNLELTGQMVTARGRARTFWGRLTEGKTFRDALAFEPQSLIAEVLNEGLYNIWANMPEVELFSQVYDSVAGQVPIKKIDTLAPTMLEYLRVPIKIKGRTLVIPAEIKVGNNLRDMEKLKI